MKGFIPFFTTSNSDVHISDVAMRIVTTIKKFIMKEKLQKASTAVVPSHVINHENLFIQHTICILLRSKFTNGS